jgi:diaminohydroxyphosphoribosylaminopyrimidine deaminase/5-amino-6-(5-phosphoribosylamino)uracil reductase
MDPNPHCKPPDPHALGSHPQSTASFEARWMQLAIDQAERAIGLSDPNPRVGCVLVSPNNELLGTGHTQRAGGPHAEVMALRDAQAQGHSVRGATAYVTLEPCAHHGRTPPCCDALIEAGVARVLYACEDPFEQVCGQGAARLRDALIEADLWPPGALQAQAQSLNVGFFSRVQRGRPWVRLKVAASLDGRTALPNGSSQWITSEAARVDGHAWRRRAGAIVTGVGTVIADDPMLNVRHHPCPNPPLRVVLDSRLRTPASARMFDVPGRVLIYTHTDTRHSEAAKALRGRGAELAPIESPGPSLDLGAVLQDLGRRGINELHVEAGQTLNAALWIGGWVDELLIYVAPVLLGPGAALAHLPELHSLGEARRLQWVDVQSIGSDLRLRATPMPSQPA